MIAFIDQYRDRFSVEFICKTLNEQRQAGFITPAAMVTLSMVRPALGASQTVSWLPRLSRSMGRTMVSTVCGKCGTRAPVAASRLAASRPLGSCGWQEYRAKARGRSPITTRKARREDTRPDLVHREFHAAGITPSTGTVGDSYDNALAENVNGSYKNELTNNHR